MNSVWLVVFLLTGSPTGVDVKSFDGPASCRAAAEMIKIGNSSGDAAAVACIDGSNGDVVYFRAEKR